MADLYVSGNQPEREEPLVGAKKEAAGKKSSGQTTRVPGYRNPLASYQYCPSNVKVDIQEKEEKIILLLRSHPITNISWIIVAIIMALSPKLLDWFPFLSFLPERFQIASLVLWYLLITAFVLEKFLIWFFSVFIVTDERVIDIDFYGLLYKETKEAMVENIEEVKGNVKGIMGTMFNYGDVTMQTAGAVAEFTFENVPNPVEVRKIIIEQHREEEQEKLEGRVR